MPIEHVIAVKEYIWYGDTGNSKLCSLKNKEVIMDEARKAAMAMFLWGFRPDVPARERAEIWQNLLNAVGYSVKVVITDKGEVSLASEDEDTHSAIMMVSEIQWSINHDPDMCGHKGTERALHIMERYRKILELTKTLQELTAKI